MPIITRENCKTYLGITVTTKDELIDMLIQQIEADYETIRGREFDIDSNDFIEYPDGSELVAAQMIAYQLQALSHEGGKMGLTGESIGDYSYTKAGSTEMMHGYPKQIVGRIKRYVRTK